MVTVHENGKTYKVQLRNQYNHIRSEKNFREMIENAIAEWEKKNPKVGESLRKKSIWEVCSWFGITTNKWEVKK